MTRDFSDFLTHHYMRDVGDSTVITYEEYVIVFIMSSVSVDDYIDIEKRGDNRIRVSLKCSLSDIKMIEAMQEL